MTNGHSIHKNNGFAPQTPENDENDENGENHARKDPVCQNPVFANLKNDYFLSLFFGFLARFRLFFGAFPAEILGPERYSHEFVFPRFWRSAGELFGVNSY